jgi:hypothetical protein
MSRAILGVLCGAGLAYAAVAVGGDTGALGQRGAALDTSAGLIALPAVVDGRQILTVIDPRTQVLAYYQFDPGKGEIILKGVRNIRWDLQIDEYNGVSPLPSEVRSLVEQR